MTHCFLPIYRLHKTDEFSSVFAFRRSLRAGVFQLSWFPNQLGTARLGLVIGKKFARQAVLRNRVKRLARESFRHSREHLPCYDLVLRLAQRIGKVNADQAMRAEIDRLFCRLKRHEAEGASAMVRK